MCRRIQTALAAGGSRGPSAIGGLEAPILEAQKYLATAMNDMHHAGGVCSANIAMPATQLWFNKHGEGTVRFLDGAAVPDAHNLAVRPSVAGELRQQQNTGSMIYNIRQ